MKFTLSWLKDHLKTEHSVEEIADKLTMIGLEVEEVIDPRKVLAPFTIARVISAEQHPNADRLRVCVVDTGSGDPVQVVCGAPNARTGMMGVFAPAGTHIPGTGLDLKPGVIRGVESNGMLCSEREMMLSDDHEGIIDLPEDAPLGAVYADYADFADPIVDIGVTPNRPDALGIHGIARDLAAAGMGTLKELRPEPVAGSHPCPVDVRLEFDEDKRHYCPAFALRMVRGVKNGPSPAWMQKRLQDIGLRPINTLVDITNYLTHGVGRPLHVFDAGKVKGDLVVRMGRAGEKLKALDGKTYKAGESVVVIADDNGVESLGGIMGGEPSGCTGETVDVLIESALWDPRKVATTGRQLNINSDARFRFERGVDPAFCLPGLEHATQLVIELCGGEPSEIVLAGEIPDPQTIVDFDPAEVSRLAGIDVNWIEAKSILTQLGFWVTGSEVPYKVAAPSWRPDIHGKADLVEEIVRIYGVDRIPPAPLERLSAVAEPVLTGAQNRVRAARRSLAARGMVEAITWSFIPKTHAEAFGGGAKELELANPISVELSDMRPSVLPGLLVAGQRNVDRGLADIAMFEVSEVYRGDRPEDQVTVGGGIRRGTAHLSGAGRHWSGNAEPVGVLDAKADALAALEAAGAPVANLQVFAGGIDWMHPGRSGTIRLGPKNILGVFGEFHPKVLELLDVEGPLCGFEVYLDAIPMPKAKATRTKPALDAADLMPVQRDFAFVVADDVEAAAIVRAAKGADKNLITNVSVFDVFAGPSLGEGRKSVAIEVTLQPRDKTMTDDEIEAVGKRIVDKVSGATGGELRS